MIKDKTTHTAHKPLFNHSSLIIHHLSKIILFGASLLLLFVDIHLESIQNWDEATNALVSEKSLETFPHLEFNNHFFFEKPPLWYWLTGISINFFGIHAWSIRFISVLSSLMLIVVIYTIGNYLHNSRAGFISGIVMVSIPHLFQINAFDFGTHTLRTGDLDSLQLLFIILSYFAFILSEKKKNWILAGFIFSALAIMVKGPFGLLPVIIFELFVFIRWLKKVEKPHISFHFIGIGLFALIVVPWYWIEIANFGEPFLQTHFLYHLSERFFSPLEGHTEPWFFFINLFFSSGFGFGFLTLAAMRSLLIQNRHFLSDFGSFGQVSAIILIVVVLTILQTKLSWYAFYLYPFSALLIGKYLSQLIVKRIHVSIFERIVIFTQLAVNVTGLNPLFIIVSPLLLLISFLRKKHHLLIVVSLAMIVLIGLFSNFYYVFRQNRLPEYCEYRDDDPHLQRAKEVYEKIYFNCK